MQNQWHFQRVENAAPTITSILFGFGFILIDLGVSAVLEKHVKAAQTESLLGTQLCRLNKRKTLNYSTGLWIRSQSLYYLCMMRPG